jgi:Leucine-rich repeat (LRR) protein
MDVAYNYLRFAGLPLNWPSTLRELHLDHNSIEKFPRKLPDSLEILSLNHNRITELPSTLPSSLHSFAASHNRIHFLPNYKHHKRFTVFLIDNNCLTEIPKDTISRIFSAEENWNEQEHQDAQKTIKQCWKRYLLGLRLRQYCRTQRTKEELFMVSMMPERWEQIDTLDPIWFGRTRRPPRSG